MLAAGLSAQVVSFHDSDNDQIGGLSGMGSFNYLELFAGQGAYSDPGNDIWNGFGYSGGYGSTYYYSAGPGAGGRWPQPYGNPGNPYAAYNYSNGNGWISSTGSALFNLNTGSPTASGNATSDGRWTPITLNVGGYDGDYGLSPVVAPNHSTNGAPDFLLGEAATNTGSTPEVFTLQNVPAGAYGLYLYGANYHNNGGALFSVNSGAAHNGIAATLNVNGGNRSPAQTFVEGQNFVIFQNVTPDANGNVTITASPNPQAGVGNNNVAGETDVNGFQLIFNPPPTAVASTAAQNVYAGGTANFSFSPAFAASPSFRWQFISGGVTNNLSDGVKFSGSLTTNLTVTGVSATNAGLYQCRITTATGTNTSPAALLTILTSTATRILPPGASTTNIGIITQTGDAISDFNNTFSAPYNSIPPALGMTVGSVEDNTLGQYINFGPNGSSPPFQGPVGFIVTPKAGGSIVTGMRFFTSSSHPEDDPADYLLEGSSDGGNTFASITGGLLALPAQRNAAGGPINVTNQVLQEIDFANTVPYTTYRLTFTNVNNDAIASNGVQIAEIQLLGSLAALTPGILQQPPAAEVRFVGATFNPDVAASGTGPFTYQWYFNTSQLIANATNATLTITNVQTNKDGSYNCIVKNPFGSITSAVCALTVVSSSPYANVVLQDDPTSYWRLDELSGPAIYDEWGLPPNNGVASTGGITFGVTGALPADPDTAETFDGFSGMINVPYTPALNTPEFTIECWALVTGGSSYRAPVCSRNTSPNVGYMFYASGTEAWQFFIGTPPGWAVLGNVPLTYGVWTYLAATYDGTTAVFYVNGQANGSYQTIYSANVSQPFRIGAGATDDATAGGLFFPGSVDEVAYYPAALSPQRIQAHYAAGVGVPLTIATVPGGTITLGWTDQANSGFTLQQAPALTGPWTTVTNTVNDINGQNQVSVTPSGKAQFFQLLLP
jgi:hypothetical protein